MSGETIRVQTASVSTPGTGYVTEYNDSADDKLKFKTDDGTIHVVASTAGSGYAIGDLLYASSATALGRLADVATGNVLLSGGVGAAPAWGKVAVDSAVSGVLPVANGGTGASLSATGGASQVLKQTSVGGAVTVGQLAASDLSNGTTGSGSVVLATSPTLVTPALGTPSAGVLTNCTALPATTSGLAGATTVGIALLTLANPGAISFNRINADNSVTARSAANFRTDLGLGTGDSPTFAGITTTSDATVGGNLAANGSAITSSSATFALLNATPTTINFAGNATTLNIGNASGTTALAGNLAVNGNTTIGDASGDTLTVNAATWTIANNVTATRAMGAAAAGSSTATTLSVTASGDAGGTSTINGLSVSHNVSGSNAIANAVSLVNALTYSGSALATTLRLNTGTLVISGTGNATNTHGYLSGFQLTNSGAVTGTHNYYNTVSPTLSSTGSVATLIGYNSTDLGHATLVTNAIGFRAQNQTASATLTVGFQSQVSSGTAKWGFYASGTADNAFNGNVRIGSTTAPTVALDVTGAALISSTLGVTGIITSSGGITMADAKNIATGTTTGTVIAATTSQKVAFHGATPVAQRASAAQAAVATTAATTVMPWGFSTQAQADAIVTLVNELRAAMVEKGTIKGSA